MVKDSTFPVGIKFRCKKRIFQGLILTTTLQYSMIKISLFHIWLWSFKININISDFLFGFWMISLIRVDVYIWAGALLDRNTASGNIRTGHRLPVPDSAGAPRWEAALKMSASSDSGTNAPGQEQATARRRQGAFGLADLTPATALGSEPVLLLLRHLPDPTGL